jgi:hypothetical protein
MTWIAVMLVLFLALGLRRGRGTGSNAMLVAGVTAVVAVWLTYLR